MWVAPGWGGFVGMDGSREGGCVGDGRVGCVCGRQYGGWGCGWR